MHGVQFEVVKGVPSHMRCGRTESGEVDMVFLACLPSRRHVPSVCREHCHGSGHVPVNALMAFLWTKDQTFLFVPSTVQGRSVRLLHSRSHSKHSACSGCVTTRDVVRKRQSTRDVCIFSCSAGQVRQHSQVLRRCAPQRVASFELRLRLVQVYHRTLLGFFAH